MEEAVDELVGPVDVGDQAFQTDRYRSYAVTSRRQSGRPIATPTRTEMAVLREEEKFVRHRRIAGGTLTGQTGAQIQQRIPIESVLSWLRDRWFDRRVISEKC